MTRGRVGQIALGGNPPLNPLKICMILPLINPSHPPKIYSKKGSENFASGNPADHLLPTSFHVVDHYSLWLRQSRPPAVLHHLLLLLLASSCLSVGHSQKLMAASDYPESKRKRSKLTTFLQNILAIYPNIPPVPCFVSAMHAGGRVIAAADQERAEVAEVQTAGRVLVLVVGRGEVKDCFRTFKLSNFRTFELSNFDLFTTLLIIFCRLFLSLSLFLFLCQSHYLVLIIIDRTGSKIKAFGEKKTTPQPSRPKL
jgi:hypothetical protein